MEDDGNQGENQKDNEENFLLPWSVKAKELGNTQSYLIGGRAENEKDIENQDSTQTQSVKERKRKLCEMKLLVVEIKKRANQKDREEEDANLSPVVYFPVNFTTE